MNSERHDPTELSAYQRDIWAAAAQDPEHPQFTVVVAEWLDGPVDTARLLRCARRQVTRTDALGLQVIDRAGSPGQFVDPDGVTVDVRVPEDGVDEWIAAAADRAFVLGEGPLAAVTLLIDGPDRCVLVVAAHHIVADTRALTLFTDSVLADYAGDEAAQVGRSYLDAVADDLAYRNSDEHARDRTALAGELADAVPVLFGRDAAGPAARHRLFLDGSLVDRMLALGESPFSFVAAAVATCLSRVHHAEEVVLGVPLLNRTERDESTVGQFANTLPLRLWTDGARTLRALAGEVRASTSFLRQHERLSLGDLLRALEPAAGGPRTPFDVTVSSMRHPRPEPVPGVRRTTTHRASAHRGDAIAIHMHAVEGRPGIEIDLHFNDGVFDDDLPAAAVAGHLETLLRAGVENPLTPVGGLSMTTPDERDRLAAIATGPEIDHPADVTVTELIERCVDRDPHAPAVGGDQPLTRGELEARANQVARGLRDRGVRCGDRVAVLLERGPELLPAVLGVLKAGAAYVPVDPSHPAERIGFVLADSGASVVLVGAGTPVPLPAGAVPVADLLHGPDERLGPVAGAADLAYVIYTSGTTGRPKGAMIEHRSVVNRLGWMQRAYPIGGSDVLLQKTPVSFDVSVWELFWWAVEGAAVSLPPPGAQRDPELLLDAIDAAGCTVVHFVPSMLEPFLDAVDAATDGRARTRSLRRIFCSGEALPPAHVEQCARVLGPDVQVVNLYGPTEATVDVSYQDCTTEPGVTPRRVPIGRPVDNTSLFVLDAHGNQQPVGVPGELCIAGRQLARGYLDRPDLTAGKFVDCAFAPGGRVYRTGDLTRWTADGTLEFLGRLDEQVKIRGNRVELGEVTDAVRRLPGVRDAVVVDRTTPDLGTRLVAYVVTSDEPDPAGYRAGLASTLPDYMLPTWWLRIDEIPLTVNGKTDRRALPDPEPTTTSVGTEPSGPVQVPLAEAWARVLGTGPIGAHDDFFVLGGDSLLMLRVRAEAAAAGVYFSLTDLLRAPTVAGLAAVATQEATGQAPVEPFELVPRVDRARLSGVEDAFPAPRLALGMLFHSTRVGDSEHYRDVFRYSLSMPWAEREFRTAFDALVRRHPAMRSSFDLAGTSEPLQLVHPSVPSPLEVVDLRGRPEEDAEAEIGRHVAERRRHRYAVDRPPLHLFRVHVLDGSVELVVSFHHAVFDGGSVAHLLSELFADYRHALGEPVDPVEDLPLPAPAEHVRDERAALVSEDDSRYWAGVLDGAPRTRIEPLAPAFPPTDQTHFARRLDLDDGLVAAVRALAAEHAVPVKSVLFAAHCLVLGRLTGDDEIVTGLVTHCRPERRHAERMVGLFLNTVPVRLPVDGTALDTVTAALHREREGHPHRRYPLSAVQQDLGGTPVFDTAFNYVHFHVLESLHTGDRVRLDRFRTWERTEFALLVNAFTDPGDGSVTLRLDFDGEQFAPEQADLVESTWLTVLRSLTTRPHRPVDGPDLAPAPRTAPAAHPAETVVHWVDDRVRSTPDVPALVDGDQTWSYARLDRAARAIAHGLVAAGVRPGSAVGIAVERSAELVAAVLGTAMAGAACLPLDTSYPRARIAAMLDRAAPAAVLAGTDELPDVGVPVLRLDDLLAIPADTTTTTLPRPAAHDPAYILFTSGSTGEPKGVVMPHRALANLVCWQNSRDSGAVGGRTLQFAPMSFDVSFQEIFSTLCGGGTLVLVPDELRRDPAGLLRLLDSARVERVFLPYVALEQLADTSALLDIVPSALRVVVSSGEQLRVSDPVRALCAARPGLLLENQYGPTETHVVCAHTLSGDPARFPALPPIGHPVDGTEVAVLDRQGRPAAVGARGEIHIGGACLADGYVRRPDLTAERFVAHPDRPEDRLYRTGDAGIALADGSVVCLGRLDDQIKVRGFRVEPAEVELAVRRIAGRTVRDAAVVAVPGDGADSRLVAFLVAAADGPTDGTEGLDGIRRGLRTELPEHLVPGHLQWIASLPTTPSGKRDDTALRAVPLTGPVGGAPAAPRDGYEHVLLDMAAELLSRSDLGVHDDLFAAGATSLTAMRLVVLIEQRFGVAVPLRTFASAPTVADVAARLRDGRAEAGYDPLVTLRAVGDGPPLFLVHPMGGNVLCYLPLVRNLPAGYPVYGLQAAGTEPGSEPVDSVERIAEAYLDAVLRVQPDGPYRLAGWSFGGFVAFEMARLLRGAGADVDELVLIDSIAPGAGDRSQADPDALMRWFFWELLWLRHGSGTTAVDLPDALDEQHRFEHLATLAVDAGVLPPGSTGALVRRLFAMFRAHWTALDGYRPARTDQDLTLVHATGPLPPVLEPLHASLDTQHGDATNGWSSWTNGRLDVVDVDGDHLDLMEEPHVRHVADVLARLLGRTRAGVTR